MSWKSVAVTISAAASLAATIALAPSEAQAHGRHGRSRVIVRGFHGFDPYFAYGWGLGWGPYWAWGPYDRPYGHREGGVDRSAAMIAGLGGIDVNVKPGKAEVWVDGKFVAEARELDGEPSYLWLKEGTHRLQIREGGYATFETKVDVHRGVVRELKVRLQPGESEAPAEGAARAGSL